MFLSWDYNQPADKFIVYGRASTQTVFHKVTSCTKVPCKINVDGRRNWYLKVKVILGHYSSIDSNTIYEKRGY